MRGTLYRELAVFGARGIIPAYAGNTSQPQAYSTRSRDHPRVCGEHLAVERLALVDAGSSPRMRGTLIDALDKTQSGGIIPAYAGNTLRDYSNFVVSKFMSFVFHLV